MTDQVVTKDSWLAQPVGSSTQYGNGANNYTFVGPIPSATTGDPDFKSRSVYEVDLTPFASLTAITSAIFTAIVAPTTCMGPRSSNLYILLEELTVDFTLKSAPGDCDLRSGTGSNVFNISNSVDTADSAFHSSGSHSTGDSLIWDIAALITRKLAAHEYTLRFRLIAANSDGTAYAESSSNTRTALYSVRNGTPANRPFITVVGTTGAVNKSASDSFSVTDRKTNITSSGSNAVDVSDEFQVTDIAAVKAAPQWSVISDSDGNGVGKLLMPAEDGVGLALLPSAMDDSYVLQVKFKLDKIPSGGLAGFRLIARAVDSHNYYRLEARIDSNGSVDLVLKKVVADIVTDIITVEDVVTLLENNFYWLKLQVSGTSPTTLQANMWRMNTEEPDTWRLETTDTESALQVSAAVGLSGVIHPGVINTPLTFYFDEFSGVTL